MGAPRAPSKSSGSSSSFSASVPNASISMVGRIYVFGDMTSRVPLNVLERLRDIESQALNACAQLKTSSKKHEHDEEREDLTLEKAALGEDIRCGVYLRLAILLRRTSVTLVSRCAHSCPRMLKTQNIARSLEPLALPGAL